MNNNLKKYMQVKRRVEQAQQDADKSEGALEQVMRELKSKFGCVTLDDAKKKLKLLQKREVSAGKEFDDAVEEFEEVWLDKLD